MQRLIDQIVKFGIVGVVATVVDYALLMLLSQVVGIDPVISAGISYCVSLVLNYLLSMRYVFSHRENLSRSREFVTFVVLSLIGFGLNELVMWLGTRALGTTGLAVTVTKAIATAIVMVWNFVSRKVWLDGGDAQ
ncbi:MAG: GtrA family protein [Atopobiaceae bacterium]|nr:GtrA family protein [Atopobiaceae bacterium]